MFTTITHNQYSSLEAKIKRSRILPRENRNKFVSFKQS